jgi:integrase
VEPRGKIAERLKRVVQRANETLSEEGLPPISADLSPHSLRRTFASLLYLRGENPVYVMHQMGHTDPKLALRIYTRVMGGQRRRAPGVLLASVLAGTRWTQANAAVSDPAPPTGAHAGMR